MELIARVYVNDSFSVLMQCKLHWLKVNKIIKNEFAVFYDFPSYVGYVQRGFVLSYWKTVIFRCIHW